MFLVFHVSEPRHRLGWLPVEVAGLAVGPAGPPQWLAVAGSWASSPLPGRRAERPAESPAGLSPRAAVHTLAVGLQGLPAEPAAHTPAAPKRRED
jgi:hypothetical protein